MLSHRDSLVRVTLVFGAFAGIAMAFPMLLALSFAGSEHLMASETLGYLIMLIALSLIFVGVKRYRDDALGGVIRFPRALLLGLMISAVAAVISCAASFSEFSASRSAAAIFGRPRLSR